MVGSSRIHRYGSVPSGHCRYLLLEQAMTTPPQPTALDLEIARETRRALVGCVDLDEQERIIATAIARTRTETIERCARELLTIREMMQIGHPDRSAYLRCATQIRSLSTPPATEVADD